MYPANNKYFSFDNCAKPNNQDNPDDRYNF